MAGRSDIRAGRAFVELFVKNNAFIAGLKAAQKRFMQFGQGLKQVGRSLIVVSAAMLVPLTLSVKKFADFDDKMREVKAVSAAVGEEFQRLTDKAKALGAATSFTAVDVAGLMAELGRAGFDPSQIENMTGAVLDLSRATSTDAAESAGIMSSAIRQFGLGAGDATRVADGLTAAANKTFNTVEGLGNALTKVGPIAADLGVSFEETLAILGTLGNLGIQGEEAGTALKRIALTAAGEADKLQGIFGVAFKDAAGNALPLVDVLEQVNEATKDLGSADRAKKFNEAFGLRGITGASAIGKAAGSTKELLADIEAAGGIASKTAAEMDAGIGGMFRMLKSAIEGVAIAIGETLTEDVKDMAAIFKAIVTVSMEWIKNNKELVKTFAKVGVAVGVAGIAFLAVGTAAIFASSAIGAFLSFASFAGGILAFLTSPVVLIVAGLTAGAAAWLKFSDSGKSALGSLQGGISSIAEVFGRFKSIFDQTWGGVVSAIMGGDLELAGTIAVTGFQVAMLRGFEFLATSIGGIWGDLIGTIGSQLLGGDFAGAWDTAVEAMSAVWVQFVTHIQEVFFNVVAAIAKGITKLKGAITSAIDALNRAEAQADFDKTEEKLQAQRTAIVNQISQLEQQAQSRVGITPGEALTEDQFAQVEAAYTDEERARWEKLAAAREAINQPTLDAVAKLNVANKALMDAEDDENDLLAGIEASRVSKIEGLQAKREKAMSDLAESTAGGASGVSDAANERDAELKRLVELAKLKKFMAETEGDYWAAVAEGGDAKKEGGDGIAAAASAQRSVAVSFSAAALQGLSGRGPIEERIAKANEENGKRLDKLIAVNEKQLMTARDGAAAVVS